LFTAKEKTILQRYLLEKYGDKNNFENSDVYVYDGGYCSEDYGTFPLGGPYNINVISTMTESIFAGDMTDQRELYGIEDSNKTLVSIDRLTGTITTVGPLVNVLPNHTVSGLAWNQANQTMYASSLNSANAETTLYTANLSTGELTVIGNTGMSDDIWLAIDSNGNAYMADLNNDSLYAIDLTDASSTLIGPLGVDLNFAQDADFHPDSGELYMGGYIGAGVNNFYKLDLTTGAATSLGTVNNNCAELTIVAIDGLFGGFPLPYCGPIQFQSNVGPITYVRIAGIDNVSDATVGGSPAHEDFTNQIGIMAVDVEYVIQLAGTTLDENTSSFTVFIDWDQDEIFDNDQERYEIGILTDSNGEDGKIVEGFIKVPATAQIGDTRMRVVKRFTSSNQYATDGCTSGSTYGQAEDYTITVVELPTNACETPTEIAVENLSETSVSINWNSPQTDIDSYYWQVYNHNQTDEDNLVQAGKVENGDTFVLVENLQTETSYDFYIRTNCDEDGLSGWEGPIVFNTTYLSTIDPDSSLQLILYPNPANEFITIQAQEPFKDIKVFSLHGQLLASYLGSGTNQIIPISDLKAGIYFVHVETESAQKIVKLIKE